MAKQCRTTRKKSTNRDFVILWCRKFERKTGLKYYPKWQAEGNMFRLLRQTYSNAELRQLIDFAFSDHPATDFLKRRGYTITAFQYCVNEYHLHLSVPEAVIPKSDLLLDTPFWDDGRVSYIWSAIRRSAINELIDNVNDVYLWALLLEKMKHQLDGVVPSKVKKFYQIWKDGCHIKRKAIKYED